MHKPLLLIVDDEEDTIKLLALRLTKNGYDVISCYNGQEAVSAAKQQTPDLAILDIKLPDMSGYEVLQVFRADPKLAKVPIIFSTADISVALKKKVKEYAADDYVIKPYEAQDLLQKIRMLLSTHKRRL